MPALRTPWPLSRALGGLFVLLALSAGARPTSAQERVLELRFTPAPRVQLAVWLERADGTFVTTLSLTEAVAVRGIGNRPGALQMNSGFRWPYGRREGALPVWAWARASAPGAELFPMVIFQDRTSEGWASRSTTDASRDDYFCLSFDQSTTGRDALDAVTCASVFNSDKGRYVTPTDVAAGYAEPHDGSDGPEMRKLAAGSLYPPRRDVERCTVPGCNDHPDVDRYRDDARRIMPRVDAVTMATPPGGRPQLLSYTASATWPDGEYVLLIEANTEGDYNDVFNDVSNPTPSTGPWDFWAMTYGYAYRGQPSVVYRIPFTLSNTGGEWSTTTPAGYGSLEGQDGELRATGERITDDPSAAPGSGADRLELGPEGYRAHLLLPPTAICSSPMAPPECTTECDAMRPCPDRFVCGDAGACVGICDVVMSPQPVDELTLSTYPDEAQSHRWAVMRFVVPQSPRPIRRYEVRFARPFERDEPLSSWQPARGPDPADPDNAVALELPRDLPAGSEVEVTLAFDREATTYRVAIRPEDQCNAVGPWQQADVTTTEIHFATVSPCFVATAAYGAPMAQDIRALRRFRDRQLLNNAAGSALVSAYYAVGPTLANAIRDHDDVRSWVRVALRPLVSLARTLDDH